jgi:hypothetical protein
MKSKPVGTINVMALFYTWVEVQSKVAPPCPYSQRIDDLMEQIEGNVQYDVED